MKKVFFIAALLLSSLLATAQVRISRENVSSDVEIQFKRCIVSGEDGFLDLVLTNHGKGCMVQVGLSLPSIMVKSSIIIYDDEGNVLKNGDGVASIKFAGEERFCVAGGDFPTDVPMALRLNLKGVSEFATQFTLIRIKFFMESWGFGWVNLRNIPIERRN